MTFFWHSANTRNSSRKKEKKTHTIKMDNNNYSVTLQQRQAEANVPMKNINEK